MGAIVRDAIVPYATARKMGWTDVDFVSQAASFDQIVAGAPGGVTEGLYVAAGTVMPYRDTANPTVAAWWDAYKAKRSEEHTSELQSLMRISYAVFCLKKKKSFYDCLTIQYVLYCSSTFPSTP